MPKKIITSNLNEEFNNAKKGANTNQKTGAKIIKNPTGVTMGKSAILEKSDLPKNVQRKMAAGVGFNGMNLMNNTKMLGSTFYHPLFQSYNMLLPRDRRERGKDTSTSCSTDTMNKERRILRGSELNDVINIRNINTTSCQISREQNAI